MNTFRATEITDEARGETVATTLPEDNGEFFFANIPAGDYILKINTVNANPLYKGSTNLAIDIVNDMEISGNPQKQEEELKY